MRCSPGRKPARLERRSAEFVEFDRPFGPFAVEQELHRTIAMLLVVAKDDDRGGERHRVHPRGDLRARAERDGHEPGAASALIA